MNQEYQPTCEACRDRGCGACLCDNGTLTLAQSELLRTAIDHNDLCNMVDAVRAYCENYSDDHMHATLDNLTKLLFWNKE